MKMRKHTGALLAALLFFYAAQAQKKEKMNWYGSVQQGLWFDNSEMKIQPVIAGGLKWKGWNTGLAASADFFSVRSLQLSADLRKEIGLMKQTFLFYANPGFNIPWPNKKKDYSPQTFWPLDEKFGGGLYAEAGAGILLTKNKNLLIAFCWSRKDYNRTYNDYIYNPGSIDYDTYRAKRKYEFNRIGMKIGYVF